MSPTDLVGTASLLRVFLRRDRLVLALWTLLPLCLLLITAATFQAMADEGLRSVLSDFDQDALIGALLGPVLSFDLPGAVVWRASSQLTLALACASVLSVIRHTRADEDTGRAELLRAYPVGRHATSTAALLLTASGNLVAGALIAAAMIALGGAPAGALAFGGTMAAVGFFFAGVAALAAELREDAGGARGAAFAVVGAALVMAFLNNFGGGTTALRWLTPMAWQRITRPFAGDDGAALLCCFAMSLVPTAIAYAVSRRRDFAAGLLPTRQARAEAAPFLSSPLALIWTMHRKGFFAWAVGIVLYIAVFAAMAPRLSERGGMSSWLSELGGTGWASELSVSFVFLGVTIYLASIFVAGWAVSLVLYLKKEESCGRVELVLDKGVGRVRWMGSYLVAAMAGSAVLLLLVGTTGGLIYGVASGNLASAWEVLAMSISKIPPVWTVAAIAAALYGVWPRATPLAWVSWFAFSVLELAWEAQAIRWSTLQLSPFAYAHYTIPIRELPLLPLVLLLLGATALMALGAIGYSRRDLRLGT